MDQARQPVVLYIDIDGVLAENPSPADPIGGKAPSKRGQKWLQALRHVYDPTIIVVTERGDDESDEIRVWLKQHFSAIAYAEINTRDPFDHRGACESKRDRIERHSLRNTGLVYVADDDVRMADGCPRFIWFGDGTRFDDAVDVLKRGSAR